MKFFPTAAFGRFVSMIPGSLGIGDILLADGRSVKGFLAEAEALTGAENITQFGGWRAFVAEMTGTKPAAKTA